MSRIRTICFISVAVTFFAFIPIRVRAEFSLACETTADGQAEEQHTDLRFTQVDETRSLGVATFRFGADYTVLVLIAETADQTSETPQWRVFLELWRGGKKISGLIPISVQDTEPYTFIESSAEVTIACAFHDPQTPIKVAAKKKIAKKKVAKKKIDKKYRRDSSDCHYPEGTSSTSGVKRPANCTEQRREID